MSLFHVYFLHPFPPFFFPFEQGKPLRCRRSVLPGLEGGLQGQAGLLHLPSAREGRRSQEAGGQGMVEIHFYGKPFDSKGTHDNIFIIFGMNKCFTFWEPVRGQNVFHIHIPGSS